MWLVFWNIAGVTGLFCFLFFVIYAFVTSVFLKRKPKLHVLGAGLCLILFITSTLLFPGEEEIVEEIADPVKIYRRGVENEKKGVFERAKKDYEIVLRLDPQNEKAAEKLQFLERREIALTFLQVAKRLCRRGELVTALVKLKTAEKITPPLGTLEGNSNLQNKIKRELQIVKQLITERTKRRVPD